jgi:hypothetical protein
MFTPGVDGATTKIDSAVGFVCHISGGVEFR